MKVKYLIFWMIILLLSSCKMKNSADLVVKNAVIYTLDSTETIAQAMAVKDGKVLATGTNKEIESAYNSKQNIDAGGHALYPGFIDAHCHFCSYGITKLRYADLTGTSSFGQVLKVLKDFSRKHPGNAWILGRGWDQNDWQNKSFPDRAALDSLFPDKPVMLTRIDGHAVLVNGKALQMAGYTPETSIEGGQLIKNHGRLTGVLLDNAADKIKAMASQVTAEELRQALLKAQEDCFAVGLTSVVNAGLDKDYVQTIDKMNKDKVLKMRIYAMLSPTAENIETYLKKGIYKTPYLHVASIKLYADGALGSRGACLLEPYSDDGGNYGFLVNSPAYLDSLCRMAYENGYQVNTHAIGDSAVRLMLDIYSRYLKPGNGRRWRIEHSQVVAPSDFQRYGELSVIPAVNTTHATSDMYWADKRLGKRVKYAYAYRRLLEQNGWLTNGSDFPVESINPLYGFYAAVARKDLSGYPEGGFQSENALTRLQALKAMTIWAAKGSFEENEKGSLSKGKVADFVITDRDIMTCDIDKVPATKILYTVSGGEIVYKNEE